MLIFIIILFGILVCFLRSIDTFVSYRNSCIEDAPFLNYDVIKNIYIVNPDKINVEKEIGWYSLYKFYITEIKKKNSDWGYYDTSKIYFNVNFLTWIYLVHCYKKYKKEEHHKNVTKAQKESLAKIINSIQIDIDRLQKQSQEEINLAQNMTNQVKENVVNEHHYC